MSPTVDSIARLRRHAEIYWRGGQLIAAQATLESLLHNRPDDIHARLRLGEVLHSRGHLRAATAQWRSLIPLLPNDATFIAQLATRLFFNGESRAARQCFEHPEVACTRSAQGLLALARARRLLDEPVATLDLFDRALAAGINTPDAHFARALMLQFTGQADAAATELEYCLRHWPSFSGAALTLMRLRHQTDARPLDAFRRHVAHIPVGKSRGIDIAYAEFQFATFKLLDDLGRYDEAWQALLAGNKAMHGLNPYDANAHVATIDTLIEQSQANAKVAPSHADGALPIFIIGLPRSGSTLLERALSNHSQVTSAGELGDFTKQLRWASDTPGSGLDGLATLVKRSVVIDPDELGCRYLEQTRWRAHGRRFYIDKLPSNYYFVHWIHRALPNAPIVHIHRTPMDACFSNFKAMFGNVSAHTYDLHALAHYYGQYRRLMNHWDTLLPGRALDVSYEQLVTDPNPVIARVLHHCGLKPETACLHPESNPATVSTFSSMQVRQPIHTRSVGQWQHYARGLEPLRQALSEFITPPNVT